MRLATSFILLATLATQILGVNAVYIECNSVGLINAVLNLLTGLLSSYNSPEKCAEYCRLPEASGGPAGAPFKYAGYSAAVSLLGLSATCACSNESPGSNGVTAGTNAAGTCSNGLLGLLLGDWWIMYVEPSTWTLSGCATGASVSGAGASFTTADWGSCLEACKYYKHMSIVTNGVAGSGAYTCQCGTNKVAGRAANCGKSVVSLYSNSLASASGVVRRRSRIEREIEEGRKRSLCPGGLVACSTIDSDFDASYECIDPTAELESCGGCLYRSVDNSTVSGVDCTQIPGVGFGGVSCVDSACIVSKCQPGWTLAQGRCLRTQVIRRR